MAVLDYVLEPNLVETPTCICGKGMRLAKIVQHPIAVDTEMRDFDCDCGHLMKLMVWTDQVLSSNFA
jgi:hypothetical protein